MKEGSVVASAARAPGFGALRGHRQEHAAAGLARLQGAAARGDRGALLETLESASGEAFFSFLFGNSPYLTRLLVRDLEFAESLAQDPPDAVVRRIRRELAEADPTMSRDRLMKFLRVQRGRVAVVAAVYDCFGLADVMECARLLSDMADHAVRLAVSHLLMDRVRRGELELPESGGPDGSRRWGYFVLAMGKHGSRELNYSSDVDLIVLYDPDSVSYTGSRSLRDCFVRVTRDLARILQARTGDGYVFRTDLRLRPDASSTPPAITVDFALNYYNTFGRTWERAALIKARPVGGDTSAAAAFLERLVPFIWDEGLDFTSVEEIRSMSQQIHDFHGHGAVTAAGHDVKLGRGGIREIEFFVHMHQLAYGGRSRRLRGTGLLAMLKTLEQENHILPSEEAALRDAYLLLRRVEHRLQMVNDDQVQKLPESADGLEQIAAMMGMASAAELSGAIERAATEVHDLYRARFNVPESEQDITAAILEGPEGSPDAVEKLEAAGFARALTAIEIFRGWAEGRYDSTSSERARTIIREILHEIIAALGKTPDPDRALARMDKFLETLPEDISFFSMLRANTWLLNLIAVVMGSAPRIADTLGGHPRLLKAVLDPAFFLPVPGRDELEAELDEYLEGVKGEDAEQRAATAATWAQDRAFQVGVQTLQNLVTVDEASESLTHIADATIGLLLRDAIRALGKKHGPVRGGSCAVVALGKLGAAEMTFESDLDLVFVADFPDEAQMTRGPKPIDAGRFYARAVQRLIGALRTRSAAGRLYEVDMRLRPSGESGPLVTTLRAFREYYASAAWTWEHMSLTRARVVAGDPEAIEAVSAEIRQVLTLPRDTETLRSDVAKMRDRVAAEYPSSEPFELKHVRGGLVDLEFIAQYLQLMHASQCPEVLAGGTVPSLQALADANVLDTEEASSLIVATQMQRSVQAITRLAWSGQESVRKAPELLRSKLANALECDTFDDLESRLRRTQSEVFDAFRRHLGQGSS